MLKELWRNNCPQLREVESRMRERAAHEYWSVQQEERRRVSKKGGRGGYVGKKNNGPVVKILLCRLLRKRKWNKRGE